MTQEPGKLPAPEAGNELSTTQVDAVSGGADSCDLLGMTNQLQAAYDNLVDTASYIMERVITATKAM
jgi:hypothetical protein